MEPLSNDLSVHDFASHQPLLAQQAPHREKTKRPQLSCNPCRARKVKVRFLPRVRGNKLLKPRSAIESNHAQPVRCTK